jgi:Predicted AAA-ATPase
MWKENTKIIAIGDESFSDVRRNADLFIDKSLLIDAIMGTGKKAILITSPRRWGKSLNLDMIKAFFQLQVDNKGNSVEINSNRILFEGGDINVKINERITTKHLEPLKISTIKNGSYMDGQGKYPVILVNLKDAGTGDLDTAMQQINFEVKRVYKEHKYLEQHISSSDNITFQKYLNGNYSKEELKVSIKFLNELLYNYHNQTEVIILVDEYDSPANHMLAKTITGENNYEINEMISFVSSMFGACGKVKNQLKKIVLTGIYNSIKKLDFSVFNNINAYGILNIDFNEYLGFSEEEVKQLMEVMEFGENSDTIKKDIDKWYNGYTLPKNDIEYTKMYAPWSVMNHLENVRIHFNKNSSVPEPQNFWAGGAGGAMLGSLIKMTASNKAFTNKLRTILPSMNETELPYVSDMSLYNTANLNNNSFTEEVITYLMLHSGYLSARKSEDGVYLFRIPNEEVRSEFFSVIERQIAEAPLAIRNSLNETEYSYINYNIEKAARAMILGGQPLLSDNLLKGKKSICWNNKINLFHLAVALNDSDSFKTILARCDLKALDQLTESTKLKPIDLLLMLDSNVIKNMIPEAKQQVDPIVMPNYYQSIYCYEHWGKTIIAVEVGVGIKFISKLIVDWKENMINVFLKLSLLGSASYIAKVFTDNYNKQICEEYNKYYSIKQNSLLGFKKYIQEHPDSIVVKDYICPESYKEIENTTVNFGIDEYEAVFTLCALGEVKDDAYGL